MAIYCCRGCIAPKRFPGCHGTCPEYLADKAKHDLRKAELDKERLITQAIYCERSDKVYKALKGYRANKCRER